MSHRQKILKYFLSGGISFVFEYGLFLTLIYSFSVEAWLGQSISYSLTIIVNFLLLRKWTFNHTDKVDMRMHIFKYSVLLVINLLLTTLLMCVFVSVGIVAYFAKVLVIIMTMMWNFIIYDKFIFVNPNQS